MNKNKFLFLTLLTIGFFSASLAKAFCPVCVVAVGAGLGFSRWLGVDDVVSSIWIGALLVAISFWTVTELRKHKKGFAYDAIIIPLAYYLLTFVPLYYAGILGHPLNKFWGTDKIIFGATVGSAAILLAYAVHLSLKKLNKNKVYFPYQKVAIPVGILILIDLILFKII